MSYEKQTWRCGDTITADRMNHIEDGIANVDVGYSCSEGWVTLTDESVTTEPPALGTMINGAFAYAEPITADTIKVTFNGTEYTCNKQINRFGYAYYGANIAVPIGETVDWTQYPFAIDRGTEGNLLTTETAGTYQVKIEAYEKTVETSECFDRARGYSCSGGVTFITSETINSVAV